MLKIALDYDGTYDADTVLWDEFMKLAKSRGHEVILTSSKSIKEGNELMKLSKLAAGIIVGAPHEKKKIAKEDYDVDFDIWIDNGKEDNGRDTPIASGTEPDKEAGVVGSTAGEGDARVNSPVEPLKRGRKPRVAK